MGRASTAKRDDRRNGDRPQPFQRPQPGEEIDLAVVVGWCDGEETLEQVKKATHDTLLDLVAERRRSGVQWVVMDRMDDVERFLAPLVEQTCPEHLANHYRRVRARLREYGGMVVAATCEGARADG